MVWRSLLAPLVAVSCMAPGPGVPDAPAVQGGSAVQGAPAVQGASGGGSSLGELVHAIRSSCAAGATPACQRSVVRATDAARARERVKNLVLPCYYNKLTVPQQLLVLADLERRDRGLPGFAGLSSGLDARALVGARANRDPEGPEGTLWGSNWAGGHASVLLANFDWMYNDGPGSPNVECTRRNSAGCWGHRTNVLGGYGPHPSLGAAFATVRGQASYVELFSSAPAGVLAFRLPRGPAGPGHVGSDSGRYACR